MDKNEKKFRDLSREERIKVMQAAELYNISKKIACIDDWTIVDMLKGISVFGMYGAEALAKVGTEQECLSVILLTTEEILRRLNESDEKNRYKVAWKENRDRIYEVVRSQFPDLFEKVEREKKQFELKERFERNLVFCLAEAKRHTSAIMTTDSELNETKVEISNIFNMFKESIENSEINEDDKHYLNEKVNASVEEAMEYAALKFKEAPVEILYYKTGNRVAVKLKWDKSSFRYTTGRGKEIHRNKGIDKKEYPWIISVSYIEEFLYKNQVRSEDILVNKNSVDCFYMFNNEISHNLTPKFVELWWGYDLPELYKLTPNKDKSVNMLGMPVCHFSNRLVYTDFSGDYIDEDITKEEIQLLIKDRERTRLYKTMQDRLKAMSIENATVKAIDLMEKVESFERFVQQAIDNSKDKIEEYLKNIFKDRVVVKDGQFTINDNFGLDCGDVFVYSDNQEYADNLSLLRQLDSSRSPYMNIKFPYLTQSTTVQSVQFDKIKEILSQEAGINLYSKCVLE